jgi:hypothetical protein
MGAEASWAGGPARSARWPVGMGLAFWRTCGGPCRCHRSDEDGSPDRDLPPPLPEGCASERLQRLEDGSGPLFRRRFRVRIEGGGSARAADGELLREPNRAAPVEVACSARPGAAGAAPGRDEFVVRMPGPWDGPVVVVDRTPTSFRFATLKGHLEAARSSSGPRPTATPSASRSSRGPQRRPALGAAVRRVKLAKEMQLHMWTHFCERAAKLARGRIRGGISIDTRGSRSRAPVAADRPERVTRALAALADRGFNFDPDQADHFTTANGWKVDDYAQPLPPEPPGPPRPGAASRSPAAHARLRLRRPGHPPGRLRHRQPLRAARHAARGPLLRACGSTSGSGSAGWSTTSCTLDGRPCGAGAGAIAPCRGTWRWGRWTTRSASGSDSGEVEFRIHAVSRPAHIPNPVVRLGFGLFGRGSSAASPGTPASAWPA